MNCQEVKDLLLSGDVTDVSDHLHECHDCRRFARGLESLDRAIQIFASEAVPEDLDAKIMSRIQHEVAKRRRRLWPSVWASVALALFSLVFSFMISVSSSQYVLPPFTSQVEKLKRFIEFANRFLGGGSSSLALLISLAMFFLGVSAIFLIAWMARLRRRHA